MVSITGSVRAGMQVAEAASHDVKRVHLELGGKAPVIVFADADLEDAAENIAIGGYFNAGQDCTAATRVLVAAEVAEEFGALLAEQARGTKVGPPSDEDALYGPLNNANQLTHVTGMLERLPEPRARCSPVGRGTATRATSGSPRSSEASSRTTS